VKNETGSLSWRPSRAWSTCATNVRSLAQVHLLFGGQQPDLGDEPQAVLHLVDRAAVGGEPRTGRVGLVGFREQEFLRVSTRVSASVTLMSAPAPAGS
jgi:hypothetical protein